MNSREIALNIVSRVLDEGAYSNLVLSKELNETNLGKKTDSSKSCKRIIPRRRAFPRRSRIVSAPSGNRSENKGPSRNRDGPSPLSLYGRRYSFFSFE